MIDRPTDECDAMSSAPSARIVWLIAIGISLGPAVSNGIARFAYGLILPAMRDELSWTYAQAGWLNTANAIGYLVGALISLAFISSLGARRLFNYGMAVTALSLILCGVIKDFWGLSALRLIAGIAGAPVFIAGGTLAATLFKEDNTRNSMAIAVYFGGGGLGQLASGAVVPLILDHYGNAVWPQIWLLLGTVSAIALVPAWMAVRSVREAGAGPSLSRPASLPYARMIPALSGYFLFGLGYLIYMTFLVAWMRDEGASQFLVAAVWSLMGIGTILSPFVWRGVLSRARGGGAMAAANLATGAGVFCALVFPAPAGVLVSAALVGLSFYIVPTSATTFGRKNLDQPQWGRSFAAFTIVFSIGQMIGPVAAGAVADATRSIALGLAGAGAILILGAAVAAVQKAIRPISHRV